MFDGLSVVGFDPTIYPRDLIRTYPSLPITAGNSIQAHRVIAWEIFKYSYTLSIFI